MQHKRRHTKRWVFISLVVIIFGGATVLMTRSIPAPQKLVEKQLDAKAFLANSQP